MRNNYPPRSIWTNPIYFIACGFGFGAMRVAPGTFGTLVAIPFYYVLRQFSLSWYVAILIVTFLIGIALCGMTAKAFGMHDHPSIVWDEMVGYWLTMLLAPTQWNNLWIIIGFILFRIFDIWKPWPIRYFDRKVHGGFGIMFDDILAAIYAWICLQIIIYLVLR